MNRLVLPLVLGAVAVAATAVRSDQPFPGTKPLTQEGDIASALVAGVDEFLLEELEKSIERRRQFWHYELSTPAAYAASLEPNRKRLAHILGLRDARVPFAAPELVATTEQPALVGRSELLDVFAVRWPAVRDVHAEGLLLLPRGDRPPLADVIAIPDADQTPEMIAGLVEGVPDQSQFARRLAEAGCRVLVPVLIDRDLQPRGGRATLTSREYLYRSAYELGRHIIGYELQKVLAGVDWFVREAGDRDPRIAIVGYGEGGMLALYAGALDPRIEAVCVSGYFDSRQDVWQQPIDRNVFGLLEQFGDAELATMVTPRTLIIEACRGPIVELPGKGGAPARLASPPVERARNEYERALSLLKGIKFPSRLELVTSSADGQGPCGASEALGKLLRVFSGEATVPPPGDRPQHLRKTFDPAARQQRQIHEIDSHNQWLLVESPYVRAEFMKKLDTSSLENYNSSVEYYRDLFRHEVVGHFGYELLPPNVRSRQSYDEPSWTGYEVVMDVFPHVIAYGILLVPKDIKPGQKRPVVVCQHGLEGRPQDVVSGDHRVMKSMQERPTSRFSRRALLFGIGAASVAGAAKWGAEAAESAAEMNDQLNRILDQPVLKLDSLDRPVTVRSIELLRHGRSYLVRSRSEDGVEAVTVPNPARMAQVWPIVVKSVAPAFVGQDARRLESMLWDVYRRDSNYKLQGIALWAGVAAMEMNLLELLGRASDRPVADFFGGRLRREIPVYFASGNRGNRPEEEIEHLQALVAGSGARALKFRLGGRMSRNKDSLPGRSEALIPLARKALGDEFTLYADSNSSYDAREAIRIGRLMEEHGYGFFEEPCEFDDLWSTKQVADALTIPVAGGEQEFSMHRWRWTIANRGVDVVQPDLHYGGGMIRATQVARMAAAAGMTVVPHMSGGGLGYLDVVQFASFTPNIGPHMEFKGNTDLPVSCESSSLRCEGGVVLSPDGPGFGVRIDPDFVRRAQPVEL